MTPRVIKSPGGIAICRTIKAGSREERGWSQYAWAQVSLNHSGHVDEAWSPWWGDCLHKEQVQGRSVRDWLHLDAVSQTRMKKLQFKENVAYNTCVGGCFCFQHLKTGNSYVHLRNSISGFGDWDLHYLLTCQEILIKPIRRQGLKIGVLIFCLKHQKGHVDNKHILVIEGS